MGQMLNHVGIHLKQKALLSRAVDRAAAVWFSKQCAQPESIMYLFYKPGYIGFWVGRLADCKGELGLKLASRTVSFNGGMSRDQVKYLMLYVVKGLDVLANVSRLEDVDRYVVEGGSL